VIPRARLGGDSPGSRPLLWYEHIWNHDFLHAHLPIRVDVRFLKIHRVALDHDSPTALYVQLADVLRGQIERGELTGRIPAAKAIAQRYEVAQGTAEKALTILRNEGLIISAVGRGHFVARRE
jgi:hypothetical protein